jgi:hypothetical protein
MGFSRVAILAKPQLGTESPMIRPLAIASILLLLSTGASAQGRFGTAQEARGMLERAVAAVKADKAKALEMFNSGSGGFLDRDLYPFCSNASDGKFVAVGPNVKHLLGTDIRALKDPNGKRYGEELYAAAQRPDGEVTAVSYMFTRPGGGEKMLVPKVTFATRVGDLGCGVGYYRDE